MEILEIKLFKKNNLNNFLVTTDVGDYLLHSDIIVRDKINLGEFDERQFNISVHDSGIIIGTGLVMKWIASSLKTEKQIRDYLKRKEYNDTIIEDIISKLKEYKVIDDSLYAKNYIESNVSFSKMKLKQKLHSLGIKSNAIDESIENVNEIDSCMKNIEKFFKTKEKTYQNKQKLIRRLNYLGFGWTTIKYSLAKFDVDLEEE